MGASEASLGLVTESQRCQKGCLDDGTALQMIKPDLAMAVGIRILGNN